MKTVTFLAYLIFTCCACLGAAQARSPLYARLGGEAGVTAIANDLIDRVVADPVTGPSFKDTKIDRIKRLLAEQLCDLAGGPCHYSGDPMKEVHAGHHISEAQFYVMVDKLRDVLKERHVDLGARNELLRLLAPMKREVVEHGKADVPAAIAAASAGPSRSASAATPQR